MTSPELRELRSILACLREAERVEDTDPSRAARLRTHARERLHSLLEESR